MADQAPQPRFLDDRLAHWAKTNPDGEAIAYLGRSFTWAQFDDRVRRLAGALAERGIGRGDVVAFLDKNHPACVETTLAAASLGAATAIINFRLAGSEMDYVLNDSGAKLMIVGAELKDDVDKIRDQIPGVKNIIEVTPEGGDGDEYEAMLAAATPRGRGADVSPDDVCVIMYSSGTTGNPKGIRLSQANLVAHTLNAGTFEFDADDKNMVSMPLFHVGGSSYAQFGIHAGIPSIMTREVDGASLAGALLGGATRTFLVPASDYMIVENWDVSGLEGTGSHDIVIETAFVPEHRIHRTNDHSDAGCPGRATNPGWLYRVPFTQVFQRAVSSACIGALEGAITSFRQRSASHVGKHGNKMAEDPNAQIAVTEAMMAADQLRLVLFRNYARIVHCAKTGEKMPVEERLIQRAQASAVPKITGERVNELMRACAASGTYKTNPIERIFRDIHQGRGHIANNTDAYARAHGGVMLGLPNMDAFV